MIQPAMQLITMLIALVLLAFVIVLGLYLFYKNRKDEDFDSVDYIKDKAKKDGPSNRSTVIGGKFHGALNTESIYRFMDFDNIVDGMIVRKGGTQYVMVLACNGINFDLRSDQEKLAIEEGFQQFLNVIKYPVQLYIQTRGINYDNLIHGYQQKLSEINEDIRESDVVIQKKRKEGSELELEEELKNKRKKINIKEYAEDAISYVSRLSNNQNVLHQKSYVVVSYYTSEMGPKINNYSKDEIQDMVFEELFTRCSTLSNALMSSGVTSRVLNSEDLIELLFNAYNRDATEFISIENHIESEYDALYSTAKEVIEKRKEKLQEEISLDAINLATSAIVKASKKRKAEIEAIEKTRSKRVKEEAKKYVESYRDRLDQKIFETAMENLEKVEIEDIEDIDNE